MQKQDYITSEKTIFTPISESALAEMRRQWGDKIVFAHGHYWAMTSPGFYRATHWLARLPVADAVRPGRLCWGFHTTISSADAHRSNGFLPLHVLSDLQHYDIQSLSSRRRTKVRSCYKQVEFVEICRPEPLFEEGYRVIQSAQDRTEHRQWNSQKRFQKYIRSFFEKAHGKIIAGLVEGRIKGLACCFAVGSTAYLHTVDIASDALKTNIGTGLLYEVAQIAKRSGFINELVNSPHTPEKPSLSEHKIGMGFDLVLVPSRVWLLPPSNLLVRLVKPHAFYRLTGQRQGIASTGKCEAEYTSD